jgi:hypothetical protein
MISAWPGASNGFSFSELLAGPGSFPAIEERTEEFPSPWHREAYIAALQREIEACDYKLKHLSDDPLFQGFVDVQRAELVSEKESALAELERLGVKPRGK